MSQHHYPRHRSLFGSILFTIVLLGSIPLAIRQMNTGVAISALVSAVVLVAAFHVAFRGADFFGLVFANAIGVYACLFEVLASVNFPAARPISLQVGFVLPLLAFGVGVLTRRRKIEHLLASSEEQKVSVLKGATLWGGPLAIVAILTTFLRSPIGRRTPRMARC
jgi:voltage-gated potassium channel